MARILRVKNASASDSLRLPDWTDTVELDSAVAQSYTVPSTADLLLINPVLQSDGTAAPIYIARGAQTGITTAVGSAFANQPANDGVEVLSSDNADTTQTITIIGTTQGTDTVVTEDVALTGTTFAATVKTDWGVILAVKLDASCAGTVTVREASANQTITTLLTTVTSKGVNTVTNTDANARLLDVVASGATTKQIGFKGTNSAGTVIYDSQALNGTTAVKSNSVFTSLTEVYTGDLENSVTATVAYNIAVVPTADDTTGASPVPITGPAMFRVERGDSLSLIRAGSATANVCISAWNMNQGGT